MEKSKINGTQKQEIRKDVLNRIPPSFRFELLRKCERRMKGESLIQRITAHNRSNISATAKPLPSITNLLHREDIHNHPTFKR